MILSSPAVHAHKLADGAVNWDVMKPSDEAAEETPAEESSEPSSFRMSVRDFRISDAAIRYEDDSTNMRFSTAPLSLRLRGNMSADRTDLDLRLTAQEMRFVSGGIPLLSGAEAELVAVIDADLANSRFTFSRNTLRLNAISVGLDGWVELGDDAVAMGPHGGLRQSAVQRRAVAHSGVLHPGIQKPHGGRRALDGPLGQGGDARFGASGL